MGVTLVKWIASYAKYTVAATCVGDPWLLPKSMAQCFNFSVQAACQQGNCADYADPSPWFRVPAGFVKHLPAPQPPRPTIASPKAAQASMVLEVPVTVMADLPSFSGPFCALVDVKATFDQGPQIVTATVPLTEGSANATLSFVGKPLGHWTLTTRVRQYMGKVNEWREGPSESLGFYVGPSWPGGNEKPVSATMLEIVSPAPGASIPPQGSSVVIRVHRDLIDAAPSKRALLNWKYAASGGGLPGEPWPGSTPLPATIALPVLPIRGNPEWRQFSLPLDFGGAAVHKQWTLRACVRAYDTDLCQQKTFTLAGP
jgi:hypothetical protein